MLNETIELRAVEETYLDPELVVNVQARLSRIEG
jgi:hypothetical protein